MSNIALKKDDHQSLGETENNWKDWKRTKIEAFLGSLGM